MKITLALVLSFFSVITYANMFSCVGARPANDAKFCSSFKKSAICHCVQMGLPKSMCTNVDKIYSRMIAYYGSQDKACRRQKESDYQTCMDAWNCYRKGGYESHHKLCSASGKPCS